MPHTALILVDIQSDYFTGLLMPLDGMRCAATNAARLQAGARAGSAPVFHVRHVARSGYAPFFRPGSIGSEFRPSVRPLPAGTVIRKDRQTPSPARGWKARCARHR